VSFTSKRRVDLYTLQDDIAALKRDVGNLSEHLKSGAQTPVSRIDDGSRRLYRNATAESGRAVAAIGRRIDKKRWWRC
jgi:hypothetical protein